MRKSLRTGTAAAIATAFLLAAPGAAQAAPITIGSPLTGSYEFQKAGEGTLTIVNRVIPGATLTSPVDGAVIRWRLLMGRGGPFRLRVLTPAGTAYTGSGSSAPVEPLTTGLETFATDLPIKAGQTIGIDLTNGTDEIGKLPASGDFYAFWFPALADGQTLAPMAGAEQGEFAFNADIQPAPKIAAVSPSSGPAAGGTTVTITGTDFEGASAVAFGAVPAAAFTVDSERQITATAPPGAAGTSVRVAVTTVAGTASADGAFAYPALPASPAPQPSLPETVHCVVPKLGGTKAKAARRKARSAHCAIGTVTRRKGEGAKSARVVRQRPAPGAVLPTGSKVNITLAAPPPRPH